MKKIVLFLLSLQTVLFTVAQHRINIIPQPLSVSEKPGSFPLNSKMNIGYDPVFREAAQYLGTIIGVPVTRIRPRSASVNPTIQLSRSTTKDTAAYLLNIDPSSIRLSASHASGMLHGAQSLAQLFLTGNKKEIPCAIINDQPRFGYRGFMLDVSRNFASVDYVKKTIDLLSLYKMNRLHLHLTDGAGWRIQIDKYPALTQTAAWRNKGSWKEWWKGDRLFANEGEPVAYGGYYSKAQARELVAYAQQRGITIIPEIEMPGHADEVLAVYPHLKCEGASQRTGEFCIGNDSTFTFMQDVITEIMEIFPSKYIHIGGDEASKKNWKQCSKCQQRIKDNNLKNENELQSYAIRRMEKFISSKGRKLLGWDEILEGGLAPGSTVMSWRGEKGGIEAAKMGHDVIMTPGSHCYFDFYQQDPATQPEAIGGYLPLEKVYSYEPIPAELEASKHYHVLGAQANLWTEYIPTDEHRDYMIFPRIIALSEVLWSEPDQKNWKDFLSRLNKNYGLLQAKNVNYCRPSYKVDIKPVIDINTKNAIVTLSTEQHQPLIRYTTDGSDPVHSSSLYQNPFMITGNQHIRAAIFRNEKAAQKPDSLLIDFHKALGKKVTYNKKWVSYPAQKELTLVNGYKGSLTYQDGQWQGFISDMDVVIDMEQSESIRSVSCTFMQLTGPGVYMPDYIEVFLSQDGKEFVSAGKAMNDIPTHDSSLLFKTYTIDLKNTTARYIRFFAKNHNGFLFADEIVVY
jgi:hexosaminidase